MNHTKTKHFCLGYNFLIGLDVFSISDNGLFNLSTRPNPISDYNWNRINLLRHAQSDFLHISLINYVQMFKLVFFALYNFGL